VVLLLQAAFPPELRAYHLQRAVEAISHTDRRDNLSFWFVSFFLARSAQS
jgi:hypothetical protein